MKRSRRCYKAGCAALWVELRVWAEALFQSLHQQFSVPLYGGEFTRRGSNLDLAWLPLSDVRAPTTRPTRRRAPRSSAMPTAAVVRRRPS